MVLNNKTVLITGGGGFLGSHLCEGLLPTGARVRVLDNFSSGRINNLAGIEEKLDLFSGSVMDESITKEACRGVDTIIHAAFPMSTRERSMNTSEVIDFMGGLFNLLKESISNQAVFIYISSIAVYGNQKYVPIDEKHPLDPVMLHGAMKVSGEYMCRALAASHGLKPIILRVADIYGPRNTRISVPVRFLLHSIKGEPLVVYGDGKQVRSYTYVGDFVKAVIKVLSVPGAIGRVMNISSGTHISMLELALLVKEISGNNCQVVLNPNAVTDNRQLVICNDLSGKILGPECPVDMREGLMLTMDWLRKNPGYYS